jgi:hypothetical protein
MVMKEIILCIHCGAKKDYLMEECEECGCNPSGNELDEIKSIYLSTLRHEFESEKEKYAKELKEIAQRLKNGQSIDYDKKELDRLGELRTAFLSITRWHVLLWFLRTFWPLFALLGGMLLAALLLKLLNASR